MLAFLNPGGGGRMLPVNGGERCNDCRSKLGHHTIHTTDPIKAEYTAWATV